MRKKQRKTLLSYDMVNNLDETLNKRKNHVELEIGNEG